MQKQLLLALIVCGLCLALWPRGRAFVQQTWASTSSMPAWSTRDEIENSFPITGSTDVDEPDAGWPATNFWADAETRFPADWKVRVLAVEQDSPPQALPLLDRQLQAHPNDLLLLTWRLECSATLDLPSSNGPLMNPYWPYMPASSGPPPFAPAPGLPGPGPGAPVSVGTPLPTPTPPSLASLTPDLTPAQARQWRTYLTLARRGARLDPRNTYWDAMVLRGLLALGRFAEMPSLLKASRQKNIYNARQVELRRTRTQVMDRIGPDLLPRFRATWQRSIPGSSPFSGDTVLRLCERVMISRQTGQHREAMEMALGALHVAQLMRRQSTDDYDLARGLFAEALIFNRARVQPGPPTPAGGPVPGTPPMRYPYVRPRMSYANLLANGISLPAYARALKRPDVVSKLNLEWTELGVWSAALRTLSAPATPTGTPTAVGDASDRMQCVMLEAERWSRLALSGLPWIVVLGSVTSLLSRLFPFCPISESERQAVPSPYLLYIFPLGVLALLLAADTMWWERSTVRWVTTPLPFSQRIASDIGVLSRLPSLVAPATPLAILVLALFLTVGWQTHLSGRALGWRARWRLFLRPADDLVRFDVSPLVWPLCATTGWTIALAGGACFIWQDTDSALRNGNTAILNSDDILTQCQIAAAIGTGALLYWGCAWFKSPRRRLALRLWLQLITTFTLTYLVWLAVSLLLVIALAIPGQNAKLRALDNESNGTAITQWKTANYLK